MTRTAQPQDTSASVVTVDSIVAAYDAAKGAAKAAVRREAQDMVQSLLREKKYELATTYAEAIDRMVTVVEKAEVDYAKLLKVRAATLARALADIVNGTTLPEGYPDDLGVDFGDDLIFAVNGAASDLSDGLDDDEIRSAAKKLATTKITTGTKAPKHDVAAHVREAFDTLGGGFHTVTKISNVKSATYGDDKVSPGAIAAHFATKTWAARTDYLNVTFVKKGTRVDGMTSDAQADGVFVA